MQEKSWFSFIFPAKSKLSTKEVLTFSFVTLAALFFVNYTSYFFLNSYDTPLIIASMGASAVLLFVLPNSEMSKPWAFFAGHLLAAAIGITCAQSISDLSYAAPLAVSLAVLFMQAFRCMHPPGGATALIAVFGNEQINALGYQFLATPLAINLLLLLGFQLLYLQLRSAMHDDKNTIAIDQHDNKPNIPISSEDIQQALHEMDTYVDTSQEDLLTIYTLASQHSRIRQLHDINCAEIMIRDVLTFEFGSDLEEAWITMNKNKITGAPVVDQAQRVIGIITRSDFISHADNFKGKTLKQRITQLVTHTDGFHSEKPEVVGQIMSSPVQQVRENDKITDVLSNFTQQNCHRLPVVDKSQKLVGMLTRTNVMELLNKQIQQ